MQVRSSTSSLIYYPPTHPTTSGERDSGGVELPVALCVGTKSDGDVGKKMTNSCEGYLRFTYLHPYDAQIVDATI